MMMVVLHAIGGVGLVGSAERPQPDSITASPTHAGIDRSLGGGAPYVLGPRTLRAFRAQRELDAVAFPQHLDAFAVDGALVKEVLLAALTFDEAKSLFDSQRFNRSCHALQFILLGCCATSDAGWATESPDLRHRGCRCSTCVRIHGSATPSSP